MQLPDGVRPGPHPARHVTVNRNALSSAQLIVRKTPDGWTLTLQGHGDVAVSSAEDTLACRGDAANYHWEFLGTMPRPGRTGELVSVSLLGEPTVTKLP